MEYFTEQGVRLRTGYDDKKEWYLLCIRELLDNGIDFLSKYYKGKDDTVITVTIFKDGQNFRIKVRNSNYKNIPVLQNKIAIFDQICHYN